VRVWKIIAGERSKFWRQFVEEGVAAIKANEEGDLEGYPSQAEFREKIERFSSLSKKKSNEEYAEAWNLSTALVRAIYCFFIGEVTFRLWAWLQENTVITMVDCGWVKNSSIDDMRGGRCLTLLNSGYPRT